LQLAGLKWGPAPGQGVNSKTVPVLDPVFCGVGLLMPEGLEIEEIWAERPFEPNPFSKNQAGKITPNERYGFSSIRYQASNIQ